MYLAAYWLRFQGDRLESFLPRTLSTLPLVVVAQLIALWALRAYVPRPRVDWLVRVVLGAFVGAAAAAGLVSVTSGFAGTSRMVFAADALLLVDRRRRLAGCVGAAGTGPPARGRGDHMARTNWSIAPRK